MGWAAVFAGRRFALGMWRRAGSHADDTAYGNARAHTGHQYPYADTGSANFHASAYADTRPHVDSHTRTALDAGAAQRWR